MTLIGSWSKTNAKIANEVLTGWKNDWSVDDSDMMFSGIWHINNELAADYEYAFS